MTTAEPSVAVNITSLTNASCTGPCYIANYDALAVHTFNPVQTITTATLIPYVTILSNGTNATSISTRSANITLRPNSTYVSASAPLTSVVSGFTFTYPSYAIEYRNIQGYVYTMTSVNDQSMCTLENVLLPPLAASNTFVAMSSSLVPYAGDHDPHIPPQVIDNLNKIPEVAAILHTSNINSCVNAFVPKTPSSEGVVPVALASSPGGSVSEGIKSIKQDMVSALTTTAVAVATGEPVVVSAAAASHVKSLATSTTLSQAQLPSKDNNGPVSGGQSVNQPSQPGLPSPSATDLVTVASQIFTLSAGSSSRLIINSETLTPGQDITINSIRISLFPSDSSVVIGTSTIPLGPGTEKIPSIGSQALTIAEGASSALVVNGQTITPGEGEVIDGVAVSLPLSSTAAVVDTSSVGLSPLSSSGLGISPTSTGKPTSTGNLSVVGSTGGASSLKGTVNGWWIRMIGVLVSCWMAIS